jgi:hypothetical protein
LLQSRTDEAIPWLEKARSANPQGWGARKMNTARNGQGFP